jgi:methyl-accepting chemotaxis protein
MIISYLRRKNKDPSPDAAALPFVATDDAPMAATTAQPGEQTALLRQWVALAEMQKRIIKVLVSEIQGASGVVETETDALGSRFQQLALSAEKQTERVDSLTHIATGIEVDGQAVSIEEIARLLDTTLGDIVTKILMLSKDSMSMVYAMEGLKANVARVNECMKQLDGINATTNMLALNARIEAERAGSAGAAFRVVANEVRDLSKSTQELTQSMRGQLKDVTDGIVESHDTLQRVATIDLSDNVLAKERLEVLLSALVERSESLGSIVSDAVRESNSIAGVIDGMVTGIQFQDRTRQRLEHVVDVLQVIDQAVDHLRATTREADTCAPSDASDDAEWIKALLDRFTLGDVRAKFVKELIDGHMPSSLDEADPSAPSSSGSIELF